MALLSVAARSRNLKPKTYMTPHPPIIVDDLQLLVNSFRFQLDEVDSLIAKYDNQNEEERVMQHEVMIDEFPSYHINLIGNISKLVQKELEEQFKRVNIVIIFNGLSFLCLFEYSNHLFRLILVLRKG